MKHLSYGQEKPALDFNPIEGLEVTEVPYWEWMLETIPPPTGWEQTEPGVLG